MGVWVGGLREKKKFLGDSRHEGQAPEIDGVVYLNDGPTDLTRPPQARQDVPLPVLTLPPQASSHPPAPSLPGQAPFHRDAPLPVPGDFVKVEITDAAAYELVGRIVG